MLVYVLGAIFVTALALAISALLIVRASLPQLDGERVERSLGAAVRVERDALGVVSLSGTSRDDLAYATGFVHAQDRFFQMDLLRRTGGGELAALIGPAAVPLDARNRIHAFRARARSAVSALTSDERRLLQRYTAGVNDGLNALSARPFEYWLLREQPQPWKMEDSLLAVYAMYVDLQYGEIRRTLARSALQQRVSPELLAFLLPTSSHWDAPLDGVSMQHSVPITPALPDWLRMQSPEPLKQNHIQTSTLAPARDCDPITCSGLSMTGSNAWAVDAAHSAGHHATIASDMHLSLGLPNIWYRMSLSYRATNGDVRRVTGVTLPGTPTVTAGSNGQVAWGFTNSYGRFVDLIELTRDARDPSRYRVPGGASETLRVEHERIDVRGAAPRQIERIITRWGPVANVGDKSYAIRWTAHDSNAANLTLLRMETADTVAAALAVAQRSGIPTQNMLVADAHGDIGWTLAGPLPRRAASAGSANTTALLDLAPRSEAYIGWDRYLSPAEYPSVVNPTTGRLWNANNRQFAGHEQVKIGDSGADVGARATQIRDDLLARPVSSPTDMLAIQTDDRAHWIEPWRRLALHSLDDKALAGHVERARFKTIVAGWNGRADADGAGYELLRAFFGAMYSAWFGPLDEALARVQPGLSYAVASSRRLAVMETLANGHAWIPAGFADWHAFVLASIDRAISEVTLERGSLERASWGAHNRAAIMHPFARMVPAPFSALRRLLAAPQEPLPGDSNMPRVQGQSFGASERMAVSPGHEQQGIFHMPGGQSGNPASPYFLAGHHAWVRGEATPFEPGAAEHRLMLRP